jgi:hypothetical protein
VRRLLLCTLTPLVLLPLLLLPGCSSGPSSQDWASKVCSALAPWRVAITDLNRRASEQMANATTPDQTRENLIALVADARDATETARAAVAAAGIPDVAGGAEVAAGFIASLTQTRDAYATAREELLGLSADDETAFYDGVVDVLDRLNRRYQASGLELSELNSPELRDAFDHVPECR